MPHFIAPHKKSFSGGIAVYFSMSCKQPYLTDLNISRCDELVIITIMKKIIKDRKPPIATLSQILLLFTVILKKKK